MFDPSLELYLDEVVDELRLESSVVTQDALKLSLNLYLDLANAFLLVDVVFVEHGAATTLEDM